MIESTERNNRELDISVNEAARNLARYQREMSEVTNGVQTYIWISSSTLRLLGNWYGICQIAMFYGLASTLGAIANNSIFHWKYSHFFSGIFVLHLSDFYCDANRGVHIDVVGAAVLVSPNRSEDIGFGGSTVVEPQSCSWPD